MFGTSRERLRDVEDAQANLETRMKEIEQQWEDFYDKAYHTLKRTETRQRRMERQETGEAVEEAAAANGVDPVTERILARRGVNRGLRDRAV